MWWAASDLGWVVGHSYICYGPLLHGNPTVLYEVSVSEYCQLGLFYNECSVELGNFVFLSNFCFQLVKIMVF